MRLSEALRIQTPGRTVAFTGAGGKSSLIVRLSTELAERFPVLITTTTRLGLRQADLGRVHVTARSPGDIESLGHRLEDSGIVLLTGGEASNEPKWLGLEEETLAAARDVVTDAGGILLIEADGGRGRPLKAPADHEPVVPRFADLVAPVVGLQALGCPFDDRTVHRPERAAGLMGLSHGQPIEAYHVARLVGHPQGGLKGVPQGAEVRVVLNQADTEEARRLGDILGQMLLGSPRIQAAIVASARGEPAVDSVIGRVAGVVLAAGGSRRLGQPKQLLAWRGEPLVWHAVRAALDGGLSPAVVVTGDQAEAVAEAVASEDVRVVTNPAWREGQSTSVRAGLQAVRPQAEAVVFLLSDTPFVDAHLVRALVEAHRAGLPPIVAPRVGDRWGNPVLFDRATFPSFTGIEGDRGGRALFDHYPIHAIDADPRILTDIDTPDDLRALDPKT